MGLDMNLYGVKHYYGNNQPKEDGFPVSKKELELGYWRKHPNLHGFIVNEFANSVDECQDIPLELEHLKVTVKAIKEKTLPATDGPFFGHSDGSEDANSIKIFNQAIDWLKKDDPKSDESRTVYYRASW